MLVGTVISIGEQAISKKDPIIILFGEQATEDLRSVSIIQSFKEDRDKVELTIGQSVFFDNQEYIILEVGSLANENLNTIGHVTLDFSEVPSEDRLASGLYLKPFKVPKIEVGSIIHYAK
ncbi:PTS system, glucitol/sorbitol-specific IIA component [Carnobacterium iners]|uniref:PTS system, glucitol/sorbitol-specific IIA component n=2 Tax=Carnobacterium iners TaxID=1073423 RepID=A0A1X7N5E2_9LACT|nr:PTS glucitol/sorbitol transporter subunit IIA [Carnobacterium iners]SEK44141.1 PTS system, glucitol/sorbitol-specific IIA component [Carnobacterium iners]SMH32627.1 PTS system, glucitol/sorbitol-specific IIA component [Carnobacterium iners]